MCSSSWIEFRPEAKHSRPTASSFVYPLGPNLSIPPLAPAAILSYLTIVNTLKRMNTIVDDDPDTFTGSGIFDISRESYDWSGEWERCLSIGRSSYDMSLTLGYTPGALQGVWEGVFTVGLFSSINQRVLMASRSTQSSLPMPPYCRVRLRLFYTTACSHSIAKPGNYGSITYCRPRNQARV